MYVQVILKGIEKSTIKDGDYLPARLLERIDRLVYLFAGYVLVAVAVALTGYSLFAFVNKLNEGFLEASITLINDVLLALIVLELLRTVLGFVRGHGQPNVAESLIPFLVIAGISASRRILAVGASIGVEEAKGVLEPQKFSQAMIELGVSGGLIIAIGVALVILRPYLPKPQAENL